MKERLQKTDKIFLLVFLCTLIIGVWHALPETSVVGDESLYVGGVLRAYEAHTLFPSIDNAYTLSFYANYIVMLPVLATVFLWSHVSSVATIDFFYRHYAYFYLVPRLVSLLASLAIGYVLIRMARAIGHKGNTALFAIGLTLSTIIITAVMHTGKMWSLSTLLVVLSDYFFVLALTKNESQTMVPLYKSSLFWCVGTAVLATANFPLYVVACIAPLALVWKRDTRTRRRALVSGCFWSLVFFLLIAANLHGWLAQDVATASSGMSLPIRGFFYYAGLAALLAPFLLVGLIVHIRQIQNRPLFWLALSQAGLFALLLAIRVPGITGTLECLRYEFLIIILLGIALLATTLRYRAAVISLLLVSLLFFGKTLYVLSVPTTYNAAYTWISSHIAPEPVLVANMVPMLDLPLNAPSYRLVQQTLCSSRCQHELMHPISPYRYTVFHSNEGYPGEAVSFGKKAQYIISPTADARLGKLVAQFGNNPSADEYYAMNHRLGWYTAAFLTTPALGENIYVYAK